MRNEISKKFMNSLLCACCTIIIVCFSGYGKITARAEVVASGNCGTSGHESEVTWVLDDEGTLTISGTGAMCGFGSPLEYGPFLRMAVSKVIIENGVTEIGMNAFCGCSSLTSVEMADSVTIIGGQAFMLCSSLTSVEIPDSVTIIRPGAFSDCSSLTSVTIPDSVTSIGTAAFQYCSSLTSVTIPEGVTIIWDATFYGCSSLKSVTIPDSVVSIGKDAMSVMDEGGAFGGCSALTSIEIPDGVTSIGDGAFSGCSGLTSITIPNSVTSIGYGAFRGCSGLTSITIPDSVTSLGSNVFNDCSKLEKILTDSSNNFYSSDDAGLLYSKDKTTLIGCPGGKTNVTIPSSVTSIGSGAFSGCSSLASITMPSGVTSIGSSMFSGCSGLTSITIPDSVTSIENGAFSGCSKLEKILIDSNNNFYSSDDAGLLYSKDKTTLIKCPGGKISAEIPDSVTSIENGAFFGCSKLEKILTDSNNNFYSSDDAGLLYSKDKTTLIKCPGGKTNVTIPSSVTSIGSGAFFGCSSLVSITIPSGVTSIGSSMFSGCSGLTSITIPDSVTSIGDSAFFDCSGLTSITIPDSVTSIGDSAFYGCSGLASITIPDSVTSIGSSAFYRCSGLTSVIIPESVTSIGDNAFYDCSGLTSVIIPDSMTSIENWAFCGCSGLTSVIIPESVTSIGVGAFRSCRGLTNVEIPNGVTSIRGYTFDSCSGLTSVEIPNSVTSIGALAFRECTGLMSVTIPDGVTSIGRNAFQTCNGLTSVTIPDSVTSIETGAFRNCIRLKNVIYKGTKRQWNEVGVNSRDNYEFLNALTFRPECTAPVADALTFNGSAQALLKAGSSTEGTLQYALGQDARTAPTDGWAVAVPSAANAGTYYVWYKVLGADGFYDTDPVCIMVNIAACGHAGTEVRNGKDASCTADGYTGDTYCKNCGTKTLSGSVLKAVGHKWDGGKVTAEPTAEKEGVRTYTCSVCGETRTEAVAKLPESDHEHSYTGSVTTEADCENDGVKTFRCSCGDTYTEAVKALGHKWDDGKVTVEPTVEKEGVRTYTCSVCGKTKTEAVPRRKTNTEIAEEEKSTGFVSDGDGASYWYENGQRQGVKLKEDGTPDESYRGKEVYDPKSVEWYWLDNVQYGAVAKGKDVYQESLADDEGNIGKWVRYDESGHMVKGWDTNENGSYYFDPQYGTMLKGDQVIDGVSYHFDEITGIMTECSISLESHWETIDGADYWYENGQRQGKDTAHRNYRGKEVYDPESGAWYWLDNVDAGKKAVSKDVYQDALAGDWGDIDNGDGTRSGKWVRYDADGCMVKGWCAGKDAEARTIASPEEAGDEAVYYFDLTYGTMAKGKVTIDGAEYSFDPVTGVMER